MYSHNNKDFVASSNILNLELQILNHHLLMILQDKQKYSLNNAENQIEKERRVAALWGRQFMEQAIYIQSENVGYFLSGWLGLPSFSRSQSDLQYILVNADKPDLNTPDVGKPDSGSKIAKVEIFIIDPFFWSCMIGVIILDALTIFKK